MVGDNSRQCAYRMVRQRGPADQWRMPRGMIDGTIHQRIQRRLANLRGAVHQERQHRVVGAARDDRLTDRAVDRGPAGNREMRGGRWCVAAIMKRDLPKSAMARTGSPARTPSPTRRAPATRITARGISGNDLTTSAIAARTRIVSSSASAVRVSSVCCRSRVMAVADNVGTSAPSFRASSVRQRVHRRRAPARH